MGLSATQVFTGKVKLKTSVANGTAITANTNILASNVSPSASPIATFLIYVALQTNAGKLKIIRTLASGSVAAPEILNSDTDLAVNTAYVFSLVLEDGESFNIQYTAVSTVTKLIVMEDFS
jgi:hypothetical protein